MRIPPSFFLSLGRFLLFIALEAISIAMVCNNGIVQRYKLICALRDFQSFFWEKGNAIKEYSSLRDVNKTLAMENTILMQKLDDYKSKYGYVCDSTKRDFTYICAKVIKNTVNTSHNYIIIDKGYKDGVREDMGVITPNGAIGITRAVSKNYTYVLSFLNNNQQVSAKIGNTNAFGPLCWDNNSHDEAFLNEIPQHIDVKQNDTVYTSGYSFFYPANIPIGIAIDSKIVRGTHRSIRVKLLQEFRQLDYVMVVNNMNKREIDSLINNK